MWQMHVVGIVGRGGLSIDAHHRNQHNRSKVEILVYICNKTECFSYKGGCGVCRHFMHIEVLSRIKSWLGLQVNIFELLVI